MEQRSKIISGTPVTQASFAAWKIRKLEEKRKKAEEERVCCICSFCVCLFVFALFCIMILLHVFPRPHFSCFVVRSLHLFLVSVRFYIFCSRRSSFLFVPLNHHLSSSLVLLSCSFRFVCVCCCNRPPKSHKPAPVAQTHSAVVTSLHLIPTYSWMTRRHLPAPISQLTRPIAKSYTTLPIWADWCAVLSILCPVFVSFTHPGRRILIFWYMFVCL